MFRMLVRTGVAASLLLAPAAFADPITGPITVSGCYGVEDFVYCDTTTADSPVVYQDTITVCAGTCQDVLVTVYDPEVCFDRRDQDGTVNHGCNFEGFGAVGWTMLVGADFTAWMHRLGCHYAETDDYYNCPTWGEGYLDDAESTFRQGPSALLAQ